MSAFKNQTSNRWRAVSTRFDDLDEDEQKKLKNEQWAWWFSDFSRGPSTIVITFFFPAIILLASNDGICGNFQLEVGSTSFQIIIVSAVVLFAGIGCAYLFAVASKYYTLKQLWTIILVLWIFLGIITPITMTRGANFLLIVAIGGVGYSFGLSWYFSIGFVAFESMAPPDRRSQYTGIYTLATNLGSALGPLVYTIIVQYSNSQRLAICALPVFNFIALIIFRHIDFHKAKKDAKRFDVIDQDETQMAKKRRTTVAGKVLSGVLEKMTSTVAPMTDEEVLEFARKRSQRAVGDGNDDDGTAKPKPPGIL